MRARDGALDPYRAIDRPALRRSGAPARDRADRHQDLRLHQRLRPFHVGNIGILGLEKRGEESYQITLGGDATEKAAIGDLLGRHSGAGGADAVERIVGVYLAERQPGESFIDAVRRLGQAPFKAAFLASAGRPPMPLLDRQGLREDLFVRAAEGELPTPAMSSCPWADLPAALAGAGRDQRVGVEVPNVVKAAEIRLTQRQLSLVAIQFPTYSDGAASAWRGSSVTTASAERSAPSGR